MISKKTYMDILCRYPELVEPGLSLRGRNTSVYDHPVDILFDDKYGSRWVVQVRTAPIEDEMLGAQLSNQMGNLENEAPDIHFLFVADKIPRNLQEKLQHEGISWKEIELFQIKEHLKSNNDKELLEALDLS